MHRKKSALAGGVYRWKSNKSSRSVGQFSDKFRRDFQGL